MSKIKATQFKLHRAEGKSEECVTRTATTWKEADAILKAWAKTAPGPHEGYDKCDFWVTWADGENYQGRYDLKRHDTDFLELLARHIRDFIQFYAGTHKPQWMTQQQYAEAIKGTDHAEYIKFLNDYEIGE